MSKSQAKLMDLVGRIIDIFTRREISAPTKQMVLAVHDLKKLAEEYGDQCAKLALDLASKEGTVAIASQAREVNSDTGGVSREAAGDSSSRHFGPPLEPDGERDARPAKRGGEDKACLVNWN